MKLKLFVSNYLYHLENWLIKFYFLKRLNREYEVAIVKFDGLGDLVISTEYINYLIEYYKSKGLKVVLIINRNWVDFAKKEIKTENLILLNYLKFNKFSIYRIYKLLYLSRIKTKYIINLTHTGGKKSAESICSTIKSNHKFGVVDSLYSSNNYTENIALNKFDNEIYKNIKVVEYLTQKKYHKIDKKLNYPKEKVILVDPFASDTMREWPENKFNELIRFLSEEKYTIKIVGNREFSSSKNLIGIENLSGKITLLELIKLVQTSELVISNETGIAHLAEFYNTKSICILGGGHYGRFIPYYDKNTQCYPVYKEKKCFKCDWECKFINSESKRPSCIDDITVFDVIEKINKIL